MTLDQARDNFRDDPCPATAQEYLERATSYWVDGIISCETRDNVISETAPYRTTKGYSYAEVEAAMCAWEHVDSNTTTAALELKDSYAPVRARFDGWRQANGTGAMREACIRLAPWIEHVWLASRDNYTMCFDWDFVPYLLGLVTWPDDGTWPIHPSVEFTAKLVNFRFGNAGLKG